MLAAWRTLMYVAMQKEENPMAAQPIPLSQPKEMENWKDAYSQRNDQHNVQEHTEARSDVVDNGGIELLSDQCARFEFADQLDEPAPHNPKHDSTRRLSADFKTPATYCAIPWGIYGHKRKIAG